MTLNKKAAFRVIFSPANNAFFVMFGSSLLRIVNTKAEGESLLAEWGRDDRSADQVLKGAK